MTVKELINALQNCIQTSEVMISAGKDMPYHSVTGVMMVADGRDFTTRAIIRCNPPSPGLNASCYILDEFFEGQLDAAIRRVYEVLKGEEHPQPVSGFLIGKAVAYQEVKDALQDRKEAGRSDAPEI